MNEAYKRVLSSGVRYRFLVVVKPFAQATDADPRIHHWRSPGNTTPFDSGFLDGASMLR